MRKPDYEASFFVLLAQIRDVAKVAEVRQPDAITHGAITALRDKAEAMAREADTATVDAFDPQPSLLQQFGDALRTAMPMAPAINTGD